MYPLLKSELVKPAALQRVEESNQLLCIEEKLRAYIRDNHSIKDKRLLECHAHCFISLS